ncbi:MAG: DUF2029 domain-containing protein [Gemmataceae bacterium]|nr:DUF2029 domain-containing protein [Gemmataceae bacterium]
MTVPAVSASQWFHWGVALPVQALVLLTVLAFLRGARLPAWWAWLVTALGVLVFVCDQLLPFHYEPIDLAYFWRSGAEVLHGQDPYRNSFCLSPPTAFPLFALLACCPYEALAVVWTICTPLGLAALVVGARAALVRCPGMDARSLPYPVLGVVTATLLLSGACRYGIETGQLGVLVALALVLAVFAWQTQRPLLAGIGLAVATFKIPTMLPFLLRFTRREDRPAWFSLAAACAALTFSTVPLLELPQRTAEWLHNVDQLAQRGRLNFAGRPMNVDLVSMERAIRFAGIEDDVAARRLHLATVGILGVWVAWQVLRRDGLADGAAWSLIAFYAALFLYHRVYDMPILAIPLLYAVASARAEAGPRRWLHSAVACAVLGVLFLRWETVQYFAHLTPTTLLGRIVQVVVVPYAVWLILLGMVCLSFAERRRIAVVATQNTENRLAA